jgi:hypothetical protein
MGLVIFTAGSFGGCTPKSLTEKARSEGNIKIIDSKSVERSDDSNGFLRVMTPYEKVDGIAEAFNAPAAALISRNDLEETAGEPEEVEERKENVLGKECDITYLYYDDVMYVDVDGKIAQAMYIFDEGEPHRELNEFLTLFGIEPGDGIRYVNADNPAIIRCEDVSDKVRELLIVFNYSTDGSPKNAIITYDEEYDIISPFAGNK